MLIWLTKDDKCLNLNSDNEVNYNNQPINLIFKYNIILKRNVLDTFIVPGDGSLVKARGKLDAYITENPEITFFKHFK